MKRSIVTGVFEVIIIILLLSSAASAVQQLKVSSSRYSVYAPWVNNSNYNFNLSGNFTVFALHLNDGSPVSGANITFEIYANGTLKTILYNLTQQNGLASVFYNTTGQFTTKNDTGYGNWTINAYNTSNSDVRDSTNMSIINGGTNITGINSSTGTLISCSKTYCHRVSVPTYINNTANGSYPRSPYTGGFGNDKTFAEASHLKSAHWSNVSRTGCYFCHPGYSANNTGAYGYTNDVHKNKSCDFCHGNWTYITNNITDPYPGGKGIPKMPGCYDNDCHPIYNFNPAGINTLANLGQGNDINVTGENISVYSYNYTSRTPLTAHNGTSSSLITSVPCILCHGPAHNISKPDPAISNTNAITEKSQCISCHGPMHGRETNCTGCHTQDAHIIYRPAGLDNCDLCHSSFSSAVNSSKHNQTRNIAAPNCTLCHTNYNSTDSGHSGLIVNESNTCKNSGCHEQGVNGFYERHSSSSDCTTCHFANTTQGFSLNESSYSHDHNLTVEYNFYNYNISGMPVRTNGGVGLGMFPYYTCTLTCHNYNAFTGVEGKIDVSASGWLQSSHARGPAKSSKYNGSCLPCHSPPMYNASNGATIAASDVQGIQCKVCHNLHDRKYPNNTGPGSWPVAFYNATNSSLFGYSAYDAVTNATVLCEKCHAGGHHNTSRDITYRGTHKTSLGFTCADCHMNSTINTGSIHTFEVNNTATGETGCEACHVATSLHAANFSQYSLHENKVTCDACHDATFIKNGSNIVVSTTIVPGGIYKNPTTNKWTTYRGTGTPTDWTFHNITKNVTCEKCHGGYSLKNGTASQTTPIALNFSEGGKSCISCHDTGGLAGEGKLVEVSSSGDSNHKDLNSAASSPSGYSSANFKCWACHGDGDGSEAAQPISGGHPLNYKTPKNCNNDDCHSLSQSQYNETMIYSHFRNASLNNNPNNNTNYNLTVSEGCQNCHINSIVTNDGNSNMAMVSHYASKKELIDSFDCVYCHLNKDNSEDWGNATLINKDRVGTIKVNKEDNNLTLFEGQTIYLGEGYSLKLIEISTLRGNGLFHILNKDNIVDQVVISQDNLYTYERDITIDNATFKTPTITILINKIFKGAKESLIKFEAYRPRKIHTEKEGINSACFACHMKKYSNEKIRFKVSPSN